MRRIFLLMAIAILSTTAVMAEGVTETSAISNYHSTVIAGKYFPIGDNATLIPPEDTEVTIECRNASGIRDDTLAYTDDRGYFSTVMDADDCVVGDEIQACLINLNLETPVEECSGWETVEATGAPGWGAGIVDIIGTPEYTTLGAGLLVLLTGGSIAYLRKRKY